MMEKQIKISGKETIPFHNNAAFCVGTGRMGLALHQEYLDQLALAQREAGFSHIRGHGLFNEDMSIFQPWKDAAGVEHDGYCFTYLDRVMDSYLHMGIRPFLELGFMPEGLASGKQTIFYWHGNTTPPADEERWVALVQATLLHLKDRYGENEVSAWPCEIWNEPNLPGFWENADEEKYHRLYEITSHAVKNVLPRMRVGGPAVCGGQTTPDWIRNFLTFCSRKNLPLDFLTRHAYMGNTPEHNGRYLYHTMRTVDSLMQEMRETREIIDSFPEYHGMEMHITEFNTSYHPFCPIHDTNLNAAYVAGILAELGDVAASYSYWTFGDVFEEQGVPSRPFHGGFGMIANQGIPKPTLWTFSFFNHLEGDAVYRDQNALLLRKKDGSYEGILWNLCHEGRREMTISLDLPLQGESCMTAYVVDEETCNPLKVWHDLGEPASLNNDQLNLLRRAGVPGIVSERIHDGKLVVRMKENAVVKLNVTPVRNETEFGYDYEWYRIHT